MLFRSRTKPEHAKVAIGEGRQRTLKGGGAEGGSGRPGIGSRRGIGFERRGHEGIYLNNQSFCHLHGWDEVGTEERLIRFCASTILTMLQANKKRKSWRALTSNHCSGPENSTSR